MIIAGIDPGKSGALAILFEDNSVEFYDVPKGKVKGKDGQPLHNLWHSSWASALDFSCPDLIVIESVGSLPKQGVTSMFNFGRSLGFIHAIALAADCRVEFATPSVWKGKLGLLNSDKNASREKFRSLFPKHAKDVSRVKDDGRAEAALLAYYGRKFLC